MFSRHFLCNAFVFTCKMLLLQASLSLAFTQEAERNTTQAQANVYGQDLR